jgi:hypothetical protein
VEGKVPSASKYSLVEWENKVKKTDGKHQKAMNKEKREAWRQNNSRCNMKKPQKAK